MKKKIFAALAASVMLCGLLTAPAAADTAEDKSVETNLSNFFELSLSEIETQLEHQFDNCDNTIVLNISKEQLQKQLSDLEQQKEEIGNDYVLFSQAYTSLMLEKLHLQEFYDAIDPDCIGISTPSAWVQAPDFFTIAEEEDDDTSFCSVTLRFWNNDITMKYNDEILTITPYEATLRTFYYINKYGDKIYFTSTNTPAIVTIDITMFGDATCDNAVDVADAVLIARFAAEDRDAVFTDQGRLNADVMYDGNLDIQDAERILQYIAKKISYEEFSANFDPYMVPIDFSVAGLGAPEKP